MSDPRRVAPSKIPTSIEQLDTGECELIGPENILLPEGEYQASFLHFETSRNYTKKIPGNKIQLEGGKLYLWFWIDPYGEKLDKKGKNELYIAYNASGVSLPTGQRGKFIMSRKRNYYKDHARLFGKVERRDRISPNEYRGKLVNVLVKTVTHDKRQKIHPESDQYSIIDKVIELL